MTGITEKQIWFQISAHEHLGHFRGKRSIISSGYGQTPASTTLLDLSVTPLNTYLTPTHYTASLLNNPLTTLLSLKTIQSNVIWG